MAKVLIALVDDVEDIEAVTAIDVLRRGGVEVTTASLTGALGIRTAHGLQLQADALFDEAAKAEYDCVLLPGGPGTGALRASEPLRKLLREQKERGGFIAAICAAPIALVDAGVLEPGQEVTCYPTCVMDLDRRCAGAPVVVDGRVITGQAPGAALLFALVVLQELCGPDVANRVARGMVTDVLEQ